MRLRRRAAVALTVALLAAGSFTVFASAGPAVAFSSGGLFIDVQFEAPAHLFPGARRDVPPVTCNASSPVTFVTSDQRQQGCLPPLGIPELRLHRQRQTHRPDRDPFGKAFTPWQCLIEAEAFGCRRTSRSEPSSETASCAASLHAAPALARPGRPVPYTGSAAPLVLRPVALACRLMPAGPVYAPIRRPPDSRAPSPSRVRECALAPPPASVDRPPLPITSTSGIRWLGHARAGALSIVSSPAASRGSPSTFPLPTRGGRLAVRGRPARPRA